MTGYLLLLGYAILVLIIGVIIIILSTNLGPRRETKEKGMPYESGKDPIMPHRLPWDVKYYLVAALFVLFDIEAVFLLPWAIVVKDKSSPVYIVWDAVIFLLVLLIGLFYAVKRGAFYFEHKMED